MAMQATHYALLGLHGQLPPVEPDAVVEVKCDALPIKIMLPLWGPLEVAISGAPPPSYIKFQIDVARPSQRAHDMSVDMPQIVTNLVAPIYVLHFQACDDWMQARGYSNTTTWPDALDFGRCVRNAIAHGGRLRFNNQGYRSTSWGALSLSGADHGRVIIDRDIFFGDLIALMLSNDDELVALGAGR
jgi:hypothetical protein